MKLLSLYSGIGGLDGNAVVPLQALPIFAAIVEASWRE
jgi:hypothetical protein